MNCRKSCATNPKTSTIRCFLTWSKPLRRRVRRVSHDYDIPYIAGYSVDGKIIFIDRHLPRTIRWLLKTVRVEPFLLTHEIVEKALLDELRLHYLHAHQIAMRAERDAVKAAGVSWWAYQSFMKKHEKQIEEEKLVRISRDVGPHTLPRQKGFRALGAAGPQREIEVTGTLAAIIR